MLKGDDLQYRHEINPPCFGPNFEPLIRFRLAVVDFLVDLSPDCCLQDGLVAMARQMFGQEGWHVLPDHM